MLILQTTALSTCRQQACRIITAQLFHIDLGMNLEKHKRNNKHMKTALGYLFLAFAGFLTAMIGIVIYYSVRGRLGVIDPEPHSSLYMLGVWIGGIICVVSVFPLTFYGFKWIKKESNFITPPTGKNAVQ